MHDMGTKGRPPNDSAAALRAAAREKPKKPTTRVYTADYKERILAELDELRVRGDRGQIGALLRREGLNWASISRWEKARDKGRLAPQKRGRKPTRDAAAEENERLQKRVAKLEKELRKAEIIIDVQKKLAALLGAEVPVPPDEEEP